MLYDDFDTYMEGSGEADLFEAVERELRAADASGGVAQVYPVEEPAEEKRDAMRRASLMTLEELQGYVESAQDGELAVVPDGTLDVIRKLRYDLTQALGPQEAGDLVPIFRAIDNRLAAVEHGLGEVVEVQRWTLAFLLSRVHRGLRWLLSRAVREGVAMLAILGAFWLLAGGGR